MRRHGMLPYGAPRILSMIDSFYLSIERYSEESDAYQPKLESEFAMINEKKWLELAKDWPKDPANGRFLCEPK